AGGRRASSANGSGNFGFRVESTIHSTGSAVTNEYRPRSGWRSALSRKRRWGRRARRRATAHGSGAGVSSSTRGKADAVAVGSGATLIRSLYPFGTRDRALNSSPGARG